MSKEKRDDAAYSQTTAFLDTHTLDPPTLEEVTHYLLYDCTVGTVKGAFYCDIYYLGMSTFVKGQKVSSHMTLLFL